MGKIFNDSFEINLIENLEMRFISNCYDLALISPGIDFDSESSHFKILAQAKIEFGLFKSKIIELLHEFDTDEKYLFITQLVNNNNKYFHKLEREMNLKKSFLKEQIICMIDYCYLITYPKDHQNMTTIWLT